MTHQNATDSDRRAYAKTEAGLGAVMNSLGVHHNASMPSGTLFRHLVYEKPIQESGSSFKGRLT